MLPARRFQQEERLVAVTIPYAASSCPSRPFVSAAKQLPSVLAAKQRPLLMPAPTRAN
jgi:hypothetical protein